MAYLFSHNDLNNSIFDSNDRIILDISGIKDSNDKSENQQIDISSASIEELCTIIVNDMIKAVREDLANVKIDPQSTDQ